MSVSYILPVMWWLTMDHVLQGLSRHDPSGWIREDHGLRGVIRFDPHVIGRLNVGPSCHVT
jgi:hypothetical protein